MTTFLLAAGAGFALALLALSLANYVMRYRARRTR